MVAARLFNQSENQPLETIFGGVTNGDVWQFLKRENKTIFIDTKKYFLDNLEQILGVLQAIIDFYPVRKNKHEDMATRLERMAS